MLSPSGSRDAEGASGSNGRAGSQGRGSDGGGAEHGGAAGGGAEQSGGLHCVEGKAGERRKSESLFGRGEGGEEKRFRGVSFGVEEAFGTRMAAKEVILAEHNGEIV